MSLPEEYRQYYQTLELETGASYAEVHAAYARLKELYGDKDSIVLAPLEDELSDQWKESVLARVEEAYEKLSGFYKDNGYTSVVKDSDPSPGLFDSQSGDSDGNAARVRQFLEEVDVIDGGVLRRIREIMNLEIHEVSLSTKIAKQHLKNIEEENFSSLPEEVFLRGYLTSCARLYCVDGAKVISDYLGRFRAWKQEH